MSSRSIAALCSTLGLIAIALAFTVGSARAEQVTECTTDAFCYCVRTELRGIIQQHVADIRARISAEKAKGKAVGYLSIPLSTVGGSYYGENVKIANETKERVEERFGVKAVWLLNTASPEVSLPQAATGAEYMLMWTKVLEGSDGLGDLDFVYFTGPSELAQHFGLDGHADMEKLESYYDSLIKTDENLKAVPKRAFRDYYALRASVEFSYGSHDEWNIVRMINQKRRAADAKSGIAAQMGVFFDGRQVAPGLFETPVAAGNADACRN
jgi:hypothetical protein